MTPGNSGSEPRLLSSHYSSGWTEIVDRYGSVDLLAHLSLPLAGEHTRIVLLTRQFTFDIYNLIIFAMIVLSRVLSFPERLWRNDGITLREKYKL